ncbi:hypothetical protein CQW23_22276 [Capsicum baccatum]|uniref:Uncharacterized protein n=1 Tax=Capsicum baccatum TaxID=33114 RepID=A0A2G2W0H8_CAPBA|nr:hypothetical protein CQW23_22276 [Capsicum baccatum]
MDVLISLGVLPRLVHVLKSGLLGVQKATTLAVCIICALTEMKRLVGEAGCILLPIKMLEAKAHGAREASGQAIDSLMPLAHNCRKVKRYDKSMPNSVQLLDPALQNTATYARKNIKCQDVVLVLILGNNGSYYWWYEVKDDREESSPEMDRDEHSLYDDMFVVHIVDVKSIRLVHMFTS